MTETPTKIMNLGHTKILIWSFLLCLQCTRKQPSIRYHPRSQSIDTTANIVSSFLLSPLICFIPWVLLQILICNQLLFFCMKAFKRQSFDWRDSLISWSHQQVAWTVSPPGALIASFVHFYPVPFNLLVIVKKKNEIFSIILFLMLSKSL